MPQLTLGFISAYNERVEPLMNGTIKLADVELVPTYSHPAETFWRNSNSANSKSPKCPCLRILSPVHKAPI